MGSGLCEHWAHSVVVQCPQYRKGCFWGWTCVSQVKFVNCADKITVIFSNAAGEQHYEVHGCEISIIIVLVLPQIA